MFTAYDLVQQVGGDEPPPRFSVRRWAAIREFLLRAIGLVGGGRSPLAFGEIMKITVLSAISGLAWGLLGAYLTRNVAGPHSWIAAPGGIVIGLTVLSASRWTYRKPLWFLIPTSIFSTLLAVGLFGLCIGFADLMRDIPNRIAWAVVVQSMNACLWGLLFMPFYWPLFILAFGNHALLRHILKTEAEPSSPPNAGSASLHQHR